LKEKYLNVTTKEAIHPRLREARFYAPLTPDSYHYGRSYFFFIEDKPLQ
jgi:hypothetical protein